MVEPSLNSNTYQEIHPNVPEGHLAIGKPIKGDLKPLAEIFVDYIH